MTAMDQCMFDLKLPADDGELHHSRKPTCFRTIKEELAIGLTQECDGSHYHLPIEGSYKSQRRSQLAEDYPPKLAETLAYLLQLDDNPYETLTSPVFYEGDDDLEGTREPGEHAEQEEVAAKSRMINSFLRKFQRCEGSLEHFNGLPDRDVHSVSLLAGDVKKGTIKSIQELNKTLRFAKQSSDVFLKMTSAGRHQCSSQMPPMGHALMVPGKEDSSFHRRDDL